jgi:hypothetical protein
MHAYAQTNVQLFNQLRSEGCWTEELRDLWLLRLHYIYRPLTYIARLVAV